MAIEIDNVVTFKKRHRKYVVVSKDVIQGTIYYGLLALRGGTQFSNPSGVTADEIKLSSSQQIKFGASVFEAKYQTYSVIFSGQAASPAPPEEMTFKFGKSEPKVALSKKKYRFWLDPEFTIPCVIYSSKMQKQVHLGTKFEKKIKGTLKALQKKGITAYCDGP